MTLSPDWKGTAEELVTLLHPMVDQFGLDQSALTLRNVRYWRTSGLIQGKGSRSYGAREAWEVLGVLKLRAEGIKGPAIGKRLAELSDAELQDFVQILPMSRHSSAAREMMTVLLAQGIVALYSAVDASSDRIVRQDETVPRPLQEGMNLLGRLQLEAGQDERAANVHDVLHNCTTPLQEWHLSTLQEQDFEYRTTVLIDADLFVPTFDCLSLARKVGEGADNVIEDDAFQALIETAQSTGRDADRVYTKVREYVGAHSLTTLADLYAFANREGFTNTVLALMTDRFYQRVPEAWLIAGEACRCAHCHTLMRPAPGKAMGYRCPLSACRAEFPTPLIDERYDPALTRVVRPQLLAYWVNPAIDELRIYNKARDLGLVADLYPNKDACDVSIGNRIGIDVKSYSNPITLAQRLSRSIGRLAKYEKKVLAVPDALVQDRRDYLSLLRSGLTGEGKKLDVMKVSDVLKALEELAHV